MTRQGVIKSKEKEGKKKEEQVSRSTQETLLEELCGDDKELLEVLMTALLFNPEIIVEERVNSYIEKARESEKAKDHVKARIAYQVAGEISLYEGNLEQAQKLFKKAAEIDPNYTFKKVFEYFNRKENAERVLAAAREFYTRTRKQTERKEP